MNTYIIKKSIQLLKNKSPFVIATIIEHSGSIPRKSGSTMLIKENKNTYGSVGGGVLEAKLIEMAPQIIAKNKPNIIKMSLTSNEAKSIGMICGGNTSIMMDPILPKKKFEDLFEICLEKIKKNQRCILVTEYNKKNKKNLHYILNDKRIKNNNINIFDFQSINLNNKVVIYSPILISKKIYILGAGHIAKPTANLAQTLGFKVIIIDDRKKFANKNRFPNVHKIKIINFKNIFDVFKEIDQESFIIIITRGHSYDQISLEQALLTKSKYIGMIGSSKKRNSIFKNLKQKGFSSQDLKRVHSPIGIQIGSETPEEISLSIMAEIILINSKKII